MLENFIKNSGRISINGDYPGAVFGANGKIRFQSGWNSFEVEGENLYKICGVKERREFYGNNEQKIFSHSLILENDKGEIFTI